MAKVRFYRTYEELKQISLHSLICIYDCFYRTYEELNTCLEWLTFYAAQTFLSY